MKKSTKQVHLIKRSKNSRRGSNQSPLSRAKMARKRFMAGEKSHELTKVDVAEEILSISLQYIDDNAAYQIFCQRTFFEELAKKPGKQLDIGDVANTISQYVCKATVRRRKKEAYKISRVVDCCIKEKIEPWAFKDFIAGHGSFTKAYKHAVAKYPRTAEKIEDATSTLDFKTEQSGDSQDTAVNSVDDDVSRKKESPKPAVKDGKQTPNRKKPDWPKTEWSVNSQATTEENFSAIMSIGLEEEIWVLHGRRAYDGEYVDIYIKQIGHKNQKEDNDDFD